MTGDLVGQETVRSAVKPPRLKPARRPLPWSSWHWLVAAHPALLHRLSRRSLTHPPNLEGERMSLAEHAKRELTLCGQFAEDPAYAQSLVAAIAAFASYGHSGGSAGVAIHQLTTLLQHGNLSPLTDDPDEWLDRSEMSSAPMWQNCRNSQAFSTDGGKTYYLLSECEGGKRPMHTSQSRHQPPA